MARNYSPGGPLDEAEVSIGANVVVFMGFVAAGCAYIILAKLWGIDAFLVTFVPVAIMIVYALLIVLARGLRLRDDQSGDNLYYMGFLFTLTSLGVSLYQFSAARAAEEIVQNFGIAIGSTIAGIGLRVIFNQMRRDPVEVEQTSRLELAEAARRVRRELDSSVVEFGYFRRTAQQSAADSFSHMTERFDDIVAKLLASLETVTAKLSAPLEAAARQLDGSTFELTRTMGATLAASAEQLSSETDKLSVRVGAIAGALDDVAARLHSLQSGRPVDRPGHRDAAGFRGDLHRQPRHARMGDGDDQGHRRGAGRDQGELAGLYRRPDLHAGEDRTGHADVYRGPGQFGRGSGGANRPPERGAARDRVAGAQPRDRGRPHCGGGRGTARAAEAR